MSLYLPRWKAGDADPGVSSGNQKKSYTSLMTSHQDHLIVRTFSVRTKKIGGASRSHDPVSSSIATMTTEKRVSKPRLDIMAPEALLLATPRRRPVELEGGSDEPESGPSSESEVAVSASEEPAMTLSSEPVSDEVVLNEPVLDEPVMSVLDSSKEAPFFETERNEPEIETTHEKTPTVLAPEIFSVDFNEDLPSIEEVRQSMQSWETPSDAPPSTMETVEETFGDNVGYDPAAPVEEEEPDPDVEVILEGKTDENEEERQQEGGDASASAAVNLLEVEVGAEEAKDGKDDPITFLLEDAQPAEEVFVTYQRTNAENDDEVLFAVLIDSLRKAPYVIDDSIQLQHNQYITQEDDVRRLASVARRIIAQFRRLIVPTDPLKPIWAQELVEGDHPYLCAETPQFRIVPIVFDQKIIFDGVPRQEGLADPTPYRHVPPSLYFKKFQDFLDPRKRLPYEAYLHRLPVWSMFSHLTERPNVHLRSFPIRRGHYRMIGNVRVPDDLLSNQLQQPVPNSSNNAELCSMSPNQTDLPYDWVQGCSVLRMTDNLTLRSLLTRGKMPNVEWRKLVGPMWSKNKNEDSIHFTAGESLQIVGWAVFPTDAVYKPEDLRLLSPTEASHAWFETNAKPWCVLAEHEMADPRALLEQFLPPLERVMEHFEAHVHQMRTFPQVLHFFARYGWDVHRLPTEWARRVYDPLLGTVLDRMSEAEAKTKEAEKQRGRPPKPRTVLQAFLERKYDAAPASVPSIRSEAMEEAWTSILHQVEGALMTEVTSTYDRDPLSLDTEVMIERVLAGSWKEVDKLREAYQREFFQERLTELQTRLTQWWEEVQVAVRPSTSHVRRMGWRSRKERAHAGSLSERFVLLQSQYNHHYGKAADALRHVLLEEDLEEAPVYDHVVKVDGELVDLSRQGFDPSHYSAAFRRLHNSKGYPDPKLLFEGIQPNHLHIKVASDLLEIASKIHIPLDPLSIVRVTHDVVQAYIEMPSLVAYLMEKQRDLPLQSMTKEELGQRTLEWKSEYYRTIGMFDESSSLQKVGWTLARLLIELETHFPKYTFQKLINTKGDRTAGQSKASDFFVYDDGKFMFMVQVAKMKTKDYMRTLFKKEIDMNTSRIGEAEGYVRQAYEKLRKRPEIQILYEQFEQQMSRIVKRFERQERFVSYGLEGTLGWNHDTLTTPDAARELEKEYGKRAEASASELTKPGVMPLDYRTKVLQVVTWVGWQWLWRDHENLLKHLNTPEAQRLLYDQLNRTLESIQPSSTDAENVRTPMGVQWPTDPAVMAVREKADKLYGRLRTMLPTRWTAHIDTRQPVRFLSSYPHSRIYGPGEVSRETLEMVWSLRGEEAWAQWFKRYVPDHNGEVTWETVLTALEKGTLSREVVWQWIGEQVEPMPEIPIPPSFPTIVQHTFREDIHALMEALFQYLPSLEKEDWNKKIGDWLTPTPAGVQEYKSRDRLLLQWLVDCRRHIYLLSQSADIDVKSDVFRKELSYLEGMVQDDIEPWSPSWRSDEAEWMRRQQSMGGRTHRTNDSLDLREDQVFFGTELMRELVHVIETFPNGKGSLFVVAFLQRCQLQWEQNKMLDTRDEEDLRFYRRELDRALQMLDDWDNDEDEEVFGGNEYEDIIDEHAEHDYVDAEMYGNLYEADYE